MKIRQDRRKSHFRFLEKGALKPHRAVTTKLRQIERFGFFSTGPQRTNLSLQTGLWSNGCSGVEKMRFYDGGGGLRPPPALIRFKCIFRKITFGGFHCYSLLC